MPLRQSSSIRDAILRDVTEGNFAFGMRITIPDLARRYGTSHMPVREALRQLAGEGLVEMAPGRGARVREMDRAFVENLLATRTAIEVMLVRSAAQNMTRGIVARLEEIESELEALVAAGNFEAVLGANRSFHETINDVARNPHASALVNQHSTLVQALWMRVGYGPERFSGVENDHRHLIQALAARDSESAGALMHAHVTKAKHDLLRRMPLLEGSADPGLLAQGAAVVASDREEDASPRRRSASRRQTGTSLPPPNQYQ
jgi:DNA-binding GntR family transcriptional regulator